MLKGLRVPTHRVDAPGVLILPHDDAWDQDRIEAERLQLLEMAQVEARKDALEVAARQAGCTVDELPADVRAAAEAVILTEDEKNTAAGQHPVSRYFRGETRHQLDAPDQGPNGPTCARAYLRPNIHPTMFEIQRIRGVDRARIELETDSVGRWIRYIRAGVRRVSCGPDTLWEHKRPGDELPDSILDALADATMGAGGFNLMVLAGACARFSAPLTESEGKP